jgi:hypothetical protein
MAETNLSRLPVIHIGPKLKSQIWLEALKIAREHDHCRDVHVKRLLQSQFDLTNPKPVPSRMRPPCISPLMRGLKAALVHSVIIRPKDNRAMISVKKPPNKTVQTVRSFIRAAALGLASVIVACTPSFLQAAACIPSLTNHRPLALGAQLKGVTFDNVSNVSGELDLLTNLPNMPIARIYFDPSAGASTLHNSKPNVLSKILYCRRSSRLFGHGKFHVKFNWKLDEQSH